MDFLIHIYFILSSSENIILDLYIIIYLIISFFFSSTIANERSCLRRYSDWEMKFDGEHVCYPSNPPLNMCNMCGSQWALNQHKAERKVNAGRLRHAKLESHCLGLRFWKKQDNMMDIMFDKISVHTYNL